MRALSVVLLLLLSGCAVGPAPHNADAPESAPVAATATLDELYAEASRRLFLARPVTATLYGLSREEAGQDYARVLDDYSPAAESALRADLRALERRIAAAPAAELSPAARENQRVVASIARYFAGHPDFPVGYIDTWMGESPFVVNQINGPLIDVPGIIKNDQPVRTAAEVEDYLARLASFDRLVDSVLAKLDADVAQGWLPPRVTLQGAARYLASFLAAEPARHSLVGTFADKLAKIEGMDAATRAKFAERAAQIVATVIYPAYRKAAVRVAVLLPRGRAESGVWAQPNGVAYYQDAIHMLGDSDLSADAIHQIGLAEVARISAQMDAILKREGYTKGSVGERMNAMGDEPRFLYPDSDAGRAELIADINRYIVEMTQRMAPLFKTVPPHRVEVRAFPKETQENAPGGQYTAPSVDGSKPGTYWINLRDPKANPRYSLKSLSYHEANPGHHWQNALSLAQTDLPMLRRIAPFNAYAEGWALYCERLAAEMGMYENDPFGDLGRLQAELFRSVRLVVDTGLHHKRWTREEAIAYMAKTTGNAETDVVAEIERYMTWPGQALGYKLGQLKILALRDKAKQALGDKFDLAAFHDLVLLSGAVPMDVLDGKVQAWIAQQQ